MILKRETILKLGEILTRKFNTQMEYKSLEKFAYCLVGYFSLLAKIEHRDLFENSSTPLIDNNEAKEEDNLK